jgi:hypothetical protein
MIKYVFREDEPLRIKAAEKADPQAIGEALEKIAAGNDGNLTPRQVVDAARNQRHVLHRHFEWDDAVAAESFRLEQARNLIRIVRVEDVETQEGSTRAFLSIGGKAGRSYHPVAEVKRSADLQAAVLQQADRDLEAFQRRYRELVDVCKVVRQAQEKLRGKRARLESRAAA